MFTNGSGIFRIFSKPTDSQRIQINYVAPARMSNRKKIQHRRAPSCVLWLRGRLRVGNFEAALAALVDGPEGDSLDDLE
jgi:hypothetical protein